MDNTSHLVCWDMPFAEARYPSVSVITESGGDVVSVVIAPAGIDRYPKYLVHFSKVITLLCYEEAHAFDRGYRDLSGIEQRCCAYIWSGSPWLESYKRGAEVFGWKDLQHYLIFGGDSIVELIASGQPMVERMDKNKIIVTNHEV
jgi:hypothetical protein